MNSTISIGELLWDLLPGERKLGGASANFAFRLQELGNEVMLVSRVGDDELGKEAKQVLQASDMDTSYIQTDAEHPTGTVNVFFDADKNPDYEIIAGVAYDYMEAKAELRSKVEYASCLAFGTLAQRAETSRETIQTLARSADGAIKFCDINLRKKCYSKESVRASMEVSDIIKLNHNELREICNMFEVNAADDIESGLNLQKRFKTKVLMVTYEADGALAFFDKGKVLYSPGYQIKLENPVGAGDAFSAAFIHKFMLKRPIAECLEAANLHGAMVAMQKGAMEPIDLGTYQAIHANGFSRVIKKEFAHLNPDREADDLLANLME